ncbi:MAG: excinuclease ABC subunit UvrA [Deltaproteobacteria bacterium]|nr:excinuclease ABC subunit UvrA [Deltaproteobacteria bacterium]
MTGKIVIRGARVHNLKNIDLEIPRDRLVVITGVSGSGKSSLAFDTLYAEGRRRYLESLAADARQFLRQLEKPDVDFIDGLSPAVAIQQKAGSYTPRSTVGTVTEIYDYLRLLFARIGEPACVQCGRQIQAHTVEQIVDHLLTLPAQTRVLVMAPIVSDSKGDHRERLSELAREGFARVKVDGVVRELSEEIHLEKDRPHRIDLIVDRLVLRQGVEKRLADSLEIASRMGERVIKIGMQTVQEAEAEKELIFSQKFICVQCGIALPEITPALFSFNTPQGACPACAGLGVDLKERGQSRGSEEKNDARPCQECGGARLKKESLAVKLGGKSIAEVASLPVNQALAYFASLDLDERRKRIGQRALGEITDRLGFLLQVGLGYLSLDRPSLSLSGGEAQRGRLATQIGSSLTGVLYILDEPSIGLHQIDNARLLSLLRQLCDRGNSVIVVEHDPEAILAADHVIDMGPGAGDEGGEIVSQGTPQELARDGHSLTGQYLSGRLEVAMPLRRKGSDHFLVIKGARQHNLKNVTVEIPVGTLTCVTGVSGAGKSSLVMDILYNAMAARLYRAKAKVGAFDELSGSEMFDRVVGIDQAPIGRTPRSTPATYTGLFDPIRELFAQLPEARVRGFKADRFSFNARAGRCDACSGDGVIRVDMNFLPEVTVTCDVCKGSRYNRETLAVRYKGLSIADVLAMTVNQALQLLNTIPAVYEKLRTLREVGLDYLRLDQAASTLSGGEAQRVKLARELARRSAGRSLYILDEPTTGLHFDDVRKLLELLHRLIDEGNSMVVIEHNLDVIRSADYVVDLGPGGGVDGGQVVAKGTPEDIAAVDRSATGRYLRKLLKQL